MREQLLLVLLVSGAAACAGRPAPTATLSSQTMTSSHGCDSHLATREGANALAARPIGFNDTTARADWRVVDDTACVAKGDAFSLFAAGSSMDDVAVTLGLENRIEARKQIQQGMRAARKSIQEGMRADQERVRAASVRFHREF